MMNQKHLLSLLQNDFTTVDVVFESSVQDSFGRAVSQSKAYTYKAHLKDGVQVGDKVVVDSPSKGLSVVTVVAVDKTPRIDVHAPFDYKWIIQKVDTSRYEEMLKKEEQFLEAMAEVERAHQRQRLLEKFQAHLPEGSEARLLFDKTAKAFQEGSAQ